jgi:hypothetical protein
MLFACYALALAAAYRLASRLAAGSTLHSLALTIVVFSANLSLPATYAGFIGQLNPVGLGIAGVLLWGAEWVLAQRVQALPAVAVSTTRTLPRGARLIFITAWVTLGMMTALLIVQSFAGYSPVVNADAAWHYMPNIINLVQAGTLHEFNGLSAYFPLGYEILFTWEMIFARSFILVPILHGMFYIASLFFALLIMNFLLRDRASIWRSAAITALLVFLIGAKMVLYMRQETGKNDIFVLMLGLMSVYYLLRYWYHERDWRCVVLVGLACGLYLSAKITGFTWVAVVGLAHLTGLLSQSRWRPQWRRLGAHIALAGVPAVVCLLPWALRIAIAPEVLSRNRFVADVGYEYSVINQLTNPFFSGITRAWLVELLIMTAGAALLLAGRRWRGAWVWAGAAVLLLGLWMQATAVEFETHYGALLTTIAVSALLLWRRALPPPLTMLAGLTLLTMILLMFIPYSAWYDIFTWDMVLFATVNYRYSPATYVLFIIMILAVVIHSLDRSEHTVQIRAPARGRTQSVLAYGFLGALWLALLGQFLLGDLSGLYYRYGYWERRAPEPTHFFDWLRANVRNAVIYSINAPPLTLYGEQLSNTVYYATPGYDGYYGSQAYRWEDVRTLIERYQIEYVLVSFAFPELPQSRILPNSDVLSEIAQMRNALPVVFEDPQFTLFATPYADGRATGLSMLNPELPYSKES